MTRVRTLPDTGLGNSSYLAEVGDGLALANPLLAASDETGVPLIPTCEAATVAGPQVLDVRQDREWAEGHIPGSAHRELGALAGTTGLPDGPVTLMCGHGERAMSAASLLAARGRGAAAGVSVLKVGPADWAKATGEALEHA